MVTRLYLPSSGTAPITVAVDSGWNITADVISLPTSVTKSDTALTTRNLTWGTTSTSEWVWWQFISPPLAAGVSFTSSNYFQGIVGKCQEQETMTDSYMTYSLRVVSGDGATVRGSLRDIGGVSSEFYPAATGTEAGTRGFTGTGQTFNTVGALTGDRFVLELGLHGVTPRLDWTEMRIGDPAATADFALTADLYTDLDPWWQINADFTFSAEGAPSGQPASKRVGGVPFVSRRLNVW